VAVVPLVAAAVCPHPPLLLPEIAAGAAPELDAARAACDEAVAHLLASNPDSVVIVGGAEATREYRYPYRATFGPWGVPVDYALGDAPPGTRPVPLSIGVAVWLLRRAIKTRALERPVSWRAWSVAAEASPYECGALGAFAAASDQSVGLLVMGDGSACRGERAPGYDDPRAAPFDKAVAAALATADTEALLSLDPVLAGELLAAGRAPWQTLAGAVAADGSTWRGDLRYDEAPYGVTYFVATWSPSPSAAIMN